MKPPDTPRTLIRDLADPEAKDAQWSRFVALYEPLVHAWLNLRGLRDNALEEAVQDVLIRLVKALRNSPYDPGRARFRTYLGCIVDSVVRDWFRRVAGESRRRGELSGHAITAIQDPSPGIDERLDFQFRLAAYEVALGVIRNDPGLSAFQQTVFDACILGDEAPTTLAKRLGRRANTVIQARCRLLARVRAHADALVQGPEGR